MLSLDEEDERPDDSGYTGPAGHSTFIRYDDPEHSRPGTWDDLILIRPRMIGMKDFTTALKQVQPSAKAWFETARNVVTYADPNGEYADLTAYMRKKRLL